MAAVGQSFEKERNKRGILPCLCPPLSWFSCQAFGFFLRCAICVFLFGSSSSALHAAHPSGSPAPFITALHRTASGDVWLGTEDAGAFRWDATAGRWLSFLSGDELANDRVYAIAADRLGRVWFGSLNRGVSVYTGSAWRTFTAENAPLGERVFDIQCSPSDGDIWIATSAGIARYSESSKAWRSYTRMDGLPSDQAQCLAFNAKGDVFAGLQCGGIAIARAADQHRRWEAVAAPWYFDGTSQRNPYPLEPFGAGLPNNLINAILVTRDGTVWAGTCAGLAWSRDDGKSWRFLRGRNYAARVQGLFGGAPQDWAPVSKDVRERLLPEDYVTSLAEAADGALWVGFREQGCAVLDPGTGSIRRWIWTESKSVSLKDGYVNKLLAFPDGGVLAGGYGGGIVWVGQPQEDADAPVRQANPGATPPPLPPSASPPDDAALARMAAALAALKAKAPLPAGSAVYLGEDWATQGDWLGRHGRRYTRFCASGAPMGDLYEITDPRGYAASGVMGPHFLEDDALRSWIHWITTDNPRTLHIPDLGTRRQSDWDDHGEAYPTTFDGPDVWIVSEVPSGTHKMTFYIFNKDGHTRNNRYRDYLLEVRRYDSALPKPAVFNNTAAARLGFSKRVRSDDLTNAIPSAVLARARVHNFWGGVYKTFAVQGPGVFYTRIARQGSHNTIVSAVMLERMDEDYEHIIRPTLVSAYYPDGVVYAPPDVRGITAQSHPALAGTLRVWNEARDVCGWQGGAEAYAPMRGLALRAALARKAPDALIGHWRWETAQWTGEEHRQFEEMMTERWYQRQEILPFCRSAAFRPYSPNVIPFSVKDVEEMEKFGVKWRRFIPKGNKKPVTLKDGEGIDWRQFIPENKRKESAL